MAVRYTPISSSALRPLGAAYVPILLSEVEQEQKPSGNGECEAIVVGAGLCDAEGERAYIVYDPMLGGEKYLKYFKRFAGAKKTSKNGTIRYQNFRSNFDLAFRSHKNSIQKHPTSRTIPQICRTFLEWINDCRVGDDTTVFLEKLSE